MKILKKNDFFLKSTALIGGLPESGKTRLAATMIEDTDMLPALIVVFDGSEIVLQEYSQPGFDVVRTTDFDEIDEILDLLDSASCKYKSVYFDNITHLHRIMLENAAAERGIKLGKGNRNKFKYEQSDYGIARVAILYLCDRVLKHHKKLNIYFTTWATDYKDENNPGGNLELDLSGRLANESTGLFNLIAAMQKDFTKEGTKTITNYNMYTQATPRIKFARNKLNLLPPIITNPSLPEIRKIMLSKNTTV